MIQNRVTDEGVPRQVHDKPSYPLPEVRGNRVPSASGVPDIYRQSCPPAPRMADIRIAAHPREVSLDLLNYAPYLRGPGVRCSTCPPRMAGIFSHLAPCRVGAPGPGPRQVSPLE